MRGLVAIAVLTLTVSAGAQERVLTLDDAFRLALRNHEQFSINREALRRARLQVAKAWALLLPTLRVQGTFSIYDRGVELDFGGVGSVTIQPKNQFAGMGTFSMTLFDARSIPLLQQAKITSQATAETTAFSKSDLLYQVANSYLGVLAAERLVEINQHTVQVNKEHVRDAAARLKAGELIKLAVTRAQIEVVKAERDLTRARNALKAQKVTLAFLTGLRTPFRVGSPPHAIVPRGPVQELTVQALHNRRDLLAATHSIQAARKGLGGAWGAFVPSLSLAASSRASPPVGFAGRALSSQTVFTLDWTIFDGGTRYAELKEKHSLLREAILKRSLLARTIDREVHQGVLGVKDAEAALFASKKELELAKENHAMVMARFRAGLATTIEAVDAATQLSNAEVSVLRERLNRDTAVLTLLKALGADPVTTLTPTAVGTAIPRSAGAVTKPGATPTAAGKP